MYHGYSFLWNGQREDAFKNFFAASDLIEGLIKDNHVAFLIYIFDLVVRHDGTGYEEPLLMILQHVADMARTVFGSESQPIYLIALWLKNATISRSWLAESSLRKLLDFFQDSIGNFHSETIALLQTFATALLTDKDMRKRLSDSSNWSMLSKRLRASNVTKCAMHYEALQKHTSTWASIQRHSKH